MTIDTELMRKNLRAKTAAMLKLDVDNLTPAQSVRLDRAATLSLELNDIEERKLIGAPFDMVKYIAASEALERMLGGDPDVQQQPADNSPAPAKSSRVSSRTEPPRSNGATSASRPRPRLTKPWHQVWPRSMSLSR